MTGGQGSLFLMEEVIQEEELRLETSNHLNFLLVSSSPLIFPSPEELKKHNSFIEFITKQSGVNLWEEEHS